MAIVVQYAEDYVATYQSFPPVEPLLKPLRGVPLGLRKRAAEALARMRGHTLRAEDLRLVGEHWTGFCRSCGAALYVATPEQPELDPVSGPAIRSGCPRS